MHRIATVGLVLSVLGGCRDGHSPDSASGAPEEVDNRESRETKYDNGQLKEHYQVARDPSGSYVNDGSYLSYHLTGQKWEEGAFSRGKRTGEWTEWSESGAIRAKGHFSAGERDGDFVSYEANGQVRSQTRWKQGLADGLWTVFLAGKPSVVGAFTAGAADGLWEHKDEAGKKLGEAMLVKGTYQGAVKSFTTHVQEPACKTVLGFDVGKSSYSDVKLGFLDRAFVPGEDTSPEVRNRGHIIVIRGSEIGQDFTLAKLAFDASKRLVSVRVTMQKERPSSHGAGFGAGFKQVRQTLLGEYKLVDERVPFVGNAHSNFANGPCLVSLDAPHLSFEMTLDYALQGQEKIFARLP